MYKFLALVALFAVSINAAQITCRSFDHVTGPSISGECPIGETLTSDGNCCEDGAVISSQATCRSSAYITGPAFDGFCPEGSTLVSNDNCCDNEGIISSQSPCADKTNAKGGSDCPGMKSYCNNSVYKTLMAQQCPKTCGLCAGSPPTNCADLTSQCAANVGLCNNNVYRDLMKTQCPKTCGYCR